MRKVFILLFLAYMACCVYLMFSKADTIVVMQGNDLVARLSECLHIKPDKILHALLFVPIIPLTWLAFRPRWAVSKVLILWTGLFFGILTEVIQHYLPYRTADIADVAADVLGSVIGIPFILLSFLFYKRKQ